MVRWVNLLGSMQPWKYIAMAGITLSAIVAVLLFIGSVHTGLRWGFWGMGGRAAQYLLLALTIFASFMMALTGFIRENSRIPFTIFNNTTIEQPEQFPQLMPTPTPGGPFTQPTPISTSSSPNGSPGAISSGNTGATKLKEPTP